MKRFIPDKEFNNKLNEVFIFTKDQNDKLEYHIIKKLLECEDYTEGDLRKIQLGTHLKYNYCMRGSVNGIYCYKGLKAVIPESDFSI